VATREQVIDDIPNQYFLNSMLKIVLLALETITLIWTNLWTRSHVSTISLSTI